jgi:predicted protein tyrosine phosphatase
MIALTRACDAERVAKEIDASHRVIICDPARDFLHPGIRKDGDHLHLAFNDAVESAPDNVLATEDQIITLITFAQAWGCNRPLVVNCYAGRSRSPAVLIIMLATLYPERKRQIVEMVSAGAPHSVPNRHVVDLGDRLLGCDGRLIEAVVAITPAARGFIGSAFFDMNILAQLR